MTAQERMAKIEKLISFYKNDNVNYVAVDEAGRKHGVSVVVYRLNAPGVFILDGTQAGGLVALYREGLDRIHTILSQLDMVQLGEVSSGCDNPETFTVVDDTAEAVRGVLSGVIETHPLGALFDITVYDDNGHEVPPREYPPCIICEEDSSVCKKEHRHSDAEILDRIDTMLLVNGYYDEVDIAN